MSQLADAPPARPRKNSAVTVLYGTYTSGSPVEITHEDPARKTVSILGDCPVACRAIAHFLRSGGYEARIVEVTCGEPVPAHSDLALVIAGSRAASRLPADVPVLWLVDTREEAERVGEMCILWPCAAEDLRARVAELARPGLIGNCSM